MIMLGWFVERFGIHNRIRLLFGVTCVFASVATVYSGSGLYNFCSLQRSQQRKLADSMSRFVDRQLFRTV